MATENTLQAIDLNHLWHPFTQHAVWHDPLIIERGEGFELIDTEGRRYLDGVSSLWCNVHGHSVPELLGPIHAQADRLCHSTLLGLSHRPILELTEELLRWTPKNLSRVFYADSGSTAVEAALRIAVEWWQKQGTPASSKRKRIASLVGSYHGDTLGAVGVGYHETFHSATESLLVRAPRVRPPHVYRIEEGFSESDALAASCEETSRFFASESDTLAAFIIEPRVQGAAGIWPHAPEFLHHIAQCCQKHEVLLIADEVATGFGKTGTMFAIDSVGVEPDLLILGKGLSGGYLPISATLATERLFSGFLGRPEEYKTFFYGQTFAGNPLAAAVARANLELFRSHEVLKTLPERISEFHAALTALIEPLPNVFEVRRCGFMTGIEFTRTPGSFDPYPTADQVGPRVVRAARERGAIIRPLGNVMVLMPPVTMAVEQLKELVDISAQAITAVLHPMSVT